ncbi:MAG: DUF4292 domain-containing protein [Chitinophagaceae bacterium]
MKYIILSLCFVILINSCTSTRNKATTVLENTTSDSIAPNTLISVDTIGKDSTQQTLQKYILPNIISFIDTIQTLSIKGNFDYATSNKNFQANIHIRIQKDSLIWISITYLGFEIARILAQPHIIHIYNKLNGEIESMSFSEFLAQQHLPLNFSNPFQIIENFLLGSFLVKDIDSIQPTPITNEYLLFKTTSLSNTSILTTISCKQKTYYPISIQIPELLNYMLQINYDDWSFVHPNGYFSLLRKLSIYNIKNTQEPIIGLNLHLTQANFNKKLTFPFPIKQNYSQK